MSRKPFPFRLAATVLVFGLAAVLVVASGSFAAPPAGSGTGKGNVVREGPTPEEMAARMQQLHSWLASETPARAADHPVRITITEQDRASYEGPAAKGQLPLKIGLVKEVSPRVVVSNIDLAGIARAERPVAGGILQATEDGGFIWARSIVSQGAAAIRVHISDFNLTPSADLYFYGRSGEAFGPYQRNGPNRDGDFWTASVAGSEGILVLRHFGPATANEMRQLTFAITEVGHMGGRPRPTADPEVALNCGNPSCVEDAACYLNSPVPEDAIAKMEWVGGAFIYTCTGGLMADTDGNSSTNYFLTANHCLSRSRDAQNVEFFWRYRKSSCGSTSCSDSASPRTFGASVAATGSAGDFTLLQLSSLPPGGTPALANDHTTNVANTNGLQLYRISNPNFGPQAYSQHNVDTSATTCSGWPRGQRIYSRDITGATDGGSSGSPVLNGSGQVVGQLSGSCGFDVGDPCNAADNATVDGALQFYWASVQPFLEGGGGGCQLGQPGDPCTTNANCCSNNCKGPNGRKTCR